MNEHFQKPIVGKKLLRMLMLQLYNNPRCIYREYIQNSLDAITEAVKIGVLSKNKDGLVSITIGENAITILDNGTGIKSDDAPKVLMDIANSIKNGVNTAGQFGVGRLSGGGYCERLEFTTSYYGESVSTTVLMDMSKLKRILEEDVSSITAEQVMEDICEVSTCDEINSEHYFKVVLHNIINSADILLNKNDILSYIRQTAPIGYSTAFLTLINNCPQKDFVERHKSIEQIRVAVNEIPNVEKNYKRNIEGNGDEISKLRYFELPVHPDFGKLAWGWYAVTPFTKQIDQKDENVGIRLRKHNISLDKNILDSLFKEPRGNKYFYGEIFITNDHIEPNSGRQGMAAGEESDALKTQLKDYFNVLYQVYHKANKYKKLLDIIQERVDKLETLSEPAAKKLVVNKLNEDVKKFQDAIKKNARDEVNDIISIYKEKYETELKGKVTELMDHYCQQQSSSTIHESDEALSNDTSYHTPSYNAVSTGYTCTKEEVLSQQTIKTPTPLFQNSPELTLSTSTSITTPQHKTSCTVETTKSKIQKKSNDPFALLTEQGSYSEKEIDLLRKVYKYMEVICTPSEKKKLTKLIECAVKNIVNNNL